MSKYNKNELEKFLLEDNMAYEAVGRYYGVTGNAIKKAASRLGIELPQRRKVNPSEALHKQGKDESKIRYCVNCNCELDYSAKKFCSTTCQADYNYKDYIQKWKEGIENGIVGKADISSHLRKYFFDKSNNMCEECGWSKLNPITNKVPLQIHHIDGDCLNNIETNIKLLCPNCHSITSNYGSLNSDSKRTYRRRT